MSKDFDTTLSDAIDRAAEAAKTAGASAARTRGRKRTMRKRVAVSTLAIVCVVGGSSAAFALSRSHGGAATQLPPANPSPTASPTSVSNPTGAPATTSPSANAPESPTTSGSTGSTSSAVQGSVRSDIPDSALLADADLAAAPTGALKADSGSRTVAASDTLDPDNCDPVWRPQFQDPKYPRNPAWVNSRSKSWSGAGYTQVSESVVTYKSANDARADFVKHQGWVAGCASHFQWTDAPQKFAVATTPLQGVSDAYAIHVRMYGTDQPASSAGSQGYDYMTVILRGNSLTVLDVSQTAIDGPKPQDPGPAEMQHDVQIAAAKLAAVYASSR